MEEKEYLTEENYNKGKKVITRIALVILVLGLLIGGSLIGLGITNIKKVNSEYSDDNKAKLTEKLNEEKLILENKKNELENKGVTYNDFAEYTDGESYELKVIINVLDPSYDRCAFDEYKNNNLTSRYCSLKEQIEDIEDGFNKEFESSKSTPLFMFGAFVIMASCIMGGSIFMTAKRREITAFTVQQVMPIAQEGIEKMAPTIGKAGGEFAKEISKGIKEGLQDEEK